MEELITQLMAGVRGVWRRRWIGVMVAWVIGIVAAVFLINLPDRYEATARIYVDTKTILKPLMKDLTVEPDMDQTVGMLARTLITRPNVELLLSKSYSGAGAMPSAEREVLIESLTKRIKLTGSGHDNVFSFSFRDTDPQRARMVVQNLVSLFLESDSSSSKRDSDEARVFIDEQIKNYEQRLTESENRLKEFKLRNMGVGDASGKDYFSRITALTEEVGKLRTELRASEESRDAIKRELATEDPVLVAETSVAVVPPPTPPDPRLEAQRRLLDDLLRRYTDLHPDVVATRKLIARLEEQQQAQQAADELARARAAENKAAPRVSASTNPVFQKLKVSLSDAESAVAALRVRVADSQARLTELRASASKVPQIEAELAQLNRDYDVVRRQYEALVGRREKASISENVDATRLTSFRVIEPPRTAPEPVFPNRLLLAPVVLLLALAGGVAASYGASQLFPNVSNARELGQIVKRPVLGSVSMLVTDTMRNRSRVDAALTFTALAGLVVVYGAWIAWMSVVGRS